MIPLSITRKRNFQLNKKQFYLQIVSINPLSIRDISERIEQRSTVSSADVKAVLDALQTTIKEAMLTGKSVRLGDLGSFRPTLRTGRTHETAEEVSANDVNALGIIFTPSATLRNMMNKNALNFKIINR